MRRHYICFNQLFIPEILDVSDFIYENVLKPTTVKCKKCSVKKNVLNTTKFNINNGMRQNKLKK